SENIRNLLRLKRFGFEPQSALAFLHSGGTLPAEALARMLPEPFDSWSREMGHSGVGEALSGLHEEGGFDALTASLEKALDDYCRDILFHARYSINAPENVLAYIWGKEMEVRNIRTVLVSKSAGSDKDAAGRMLRHGY
ncbi:MAG: V-type ATPase subunit, partial [Synergistaceae bacterium]|nr:V-type ATPase subunit [Synergistaceae bacterium]